MAIYNPRFRKKVAISDIAFLDTFDERLSALDCLFVNIFGVNEDGVELCSDEPEPTEQERLAWDWLIDPSLATEVLPHCGPELQSLIEAFNGDDMATWWKEMSGGA